MSELRIYKPLEKTTCVISRDERIACGMRWKLCRMHSVDLSCQRPRCVRGWGALSACSAYRGISRNKNCPRHVVAIALVTNAHDEWRFSRVKIIIKETSSMPVAGTRRLCRMGLVAVLVTALCILTLLDSPPARLPDPPTDPPPTPGKQFSSSSATAATLALLLSANGSPTQPENANATHWHLAGFLLPCELVVTIDKIVRQIDIISCNVMSREWV